MQQRQLRPGDTLDDYCPRERRLTNHVVVAMIGDDIKQTRCTTCDADHEYKHARVPRHRKKSDAPAILASVAAAPKRVIHDANEGEDVSLPGTTGESDAEGDAVAASADPQPERSEPSPSDQEADEQQTEPVGDEGPVHRPLIRAQLPRIEGQPPVARQNPDFTIRQPGGRNNRFRPRHQRGAGGGGQSFEGNRSNGNTGNNGNTRGGPPRQHGGRPPLMSPLAKRHGSGGGRRSK